LQLIPPCCPAEAVQSAIHTNVETLKNIFEIAAIIVGGAWTYLNYFRGRTFKSRLEPSIECRAEKSGGNRDYLIVCMTLKCVGLAKVPIDQYGSGLIVYMEVPRDNANIQGPTEARWSETYWVIEVFKNHGWIESEEVVHEQVMIELPKQHAPAYKLKLKINSKNVTWTTVSTINVEHDLRNEGNNATTGRAI
jgi:hypothetical protein